MGSWQQPLPKRWGLSEAAPFRGTDANRAVAAAEQSSAHSSALSSARPRWHSVKALQGSALLCSVLGVGSTHTARPTALQQHRGCSPGPCFKGSVCNLLSHRRIFTFIQHEAARCLAPHTLAVLLTVNHFSTSAIKQLFPFIPRLADHEHAEERWCCRSTRLSRGGEESSTQTSAYLRKSPTGTSGRRIKKPKCSLLNKVTVLLWTKRASRSPSV